MKTLPLPHCVWDHTSDESDQAPKRRSWVSGRQVPQFGLPFLDPIGTPRMGNDVRCGSHQQPTHPEIGAWRPVVRRRHVPACLGVKGAFNANNRVSAAANSWDPLAVIR